MSALLIPTQRTAQPQYACGVDWSNPIANTTELLWNGSNPLFGNGKVNKLGTFYGAPTATVLGIGRTMGVTGTDDAVEFPGAYAGTGTDYTMCCLATMGNTASRRITGTSSSTNSGLHLGYSSISSTFVLTKGAIADIDSGIALSTNTPYFLAASYKHSTGAVIFLVKNLLTNGLTISSATEASAWSAGDGNYHVGGSRIFATSKWSGNIGCAAHLKTTLSNSELRSLANSPWQLFSPRLV